MNSSVMDLLHSLMEPVRESCSESGMGGSALKAARKALHELHTQDKNVETTDQLMVRNNSHSSNSFSQP